MKLLVVLRTLRGAQEMTRKKLDKLLEVCFKEIDILRALRFNLMNSGKEDQWLLDRWRISLFDLAQ